MARHPLADSQLVVVGSSAGGIEALSRVVGSLPPDFPAPIVIAQHLDPRRPSHLGEILARHATMPIKVVDAVASLEDGVIFVVPSNRLVEIVDGELRLRPARPGSIAPSVDLLLETAAAAFGPGLIAVILTGSGSDGSAGAWQVKQAGGTVIIENPATALFPSMPGSIAPSLVDATADLDSIGGVLLGILAADGTAPDAVAAAYPASSLAWAVLSEDALAGGRAVEAYAYARTGYHRGLDALRRAGWRGQGPIPWEHEPNRGFLRALAALARAANQIDEVEEVHRCTEFLRASSATGARELGL